MSEDIRGYQCRQRRRRICGRQRSGGFSSPGSNRSARQCGPETHLKFQCAIPASAPCGRQMPAVLLSCAPVSSARHAPRRARSPILCAQSRRFGIRRERRITAARGVISCGKFRATKRGKVNLKLAPPFTMNVIPFAATAQNRAFLKRLFYHRFLVFAFIFPSPSVTSVVKTLLVASLPPNK